jgi:hypothetical protein
MLLLDRAILTIPELISSHCIIGIGSHFDGINNPDSDIDLVCLKKVAKVNSSLIRFEGKILDITICSPIYIRRVTTKSRDKLHWLENLKRAVVLKDKYGIGEKLITNLTTSNHEGIPDTLKVAAKTRFISSSKKIRHFKDNCILFNVHLQNWIICAYQIHCFSMGNIPFQNPRLISEDISTRNDELKYVFNAIYLEPCNQKKCVLIEDYTNTVLSSYLTEVNILSDVYS